MQGKNIINSIFAVAAIILGAVIFYFTNTYLVLVLLPVLALYLDAMNGKYYATTALLVCCSFLAFALDLTGMLIVFMLAVSAAAGLVSLKKSVQFFDGLWYTMAAAAFSIIAGAFTVYIANGKQDLAVIAAQGIADKLGQLPAGYLQDSIIAYLTLITSPEKLMSNDVWTAYSAIIDQIGNTTRVEQTQSLVPQLKEILAQRAPAALLSGSMLFGGLVWYLPNLFIAYSIKKGRQPEGLKEFKAPREFSYWRMPRWLVTTFALLLLLVLILEFTGYEAVYGAVMAIQTIVMMAVAVQGLALVRWFLKRWNIPVWGVWILMAIAIMLSSFIAVWIGLIDILFNIRAFTENKKQIKNAMDQMREKIEEEMQRQRQEHEDNNDSDNDSDPQDDDDDKKQE